MKDAEKFFEEDLYSSAKHKKGEKETMKIRFDGQKVVARSICGTRDTFHDYLKSRQR